MKKVDILFVSAGFDVDGQSAFEGARERGFFTSDMKMQEFKPGFRVLKVHKKEDVNAGVTKDEWMIVEVDQMIVTNKDHHHKLKLGEERVIKRDLNVKYTFTKVIAQGEDGGNELADLFVQNNPNKGRGRVWTYSETVEDFFKAKKTEKKELAKLFKAFKKSSDDEAYALVRNEIKQTAAKEGKELVGLRKPVLELKYQIENLEIEDMTDYENLKKLIVKKYAVK